MSIAPCSVGERLELRRNMNGEISKVFPAGLFEGPGSVYALPNDFIRGDRNNAKGIYGLAIYPFCVGNELSSRSVSRQVLLPQQSLTSVFGMGTGGPSALRSLTWCTFRDSNPGPTD